MFREYISNKSLKKASWKLHPKCHEMYCIKFFQDTERLPVTSCIPLCVYGDSLTFGVLCPGEPGVPGTDWKFWFSAVPWYPPVCK